MTMEHYDFAILGGGSAGYAAARTAHDLGLRTVVIDGAKELSGLCILRGCMPSKTLIESGNRNLVIRHAAEFGLSATPGEADVRYIRDRKRRLIRSFADYRTGQLEDGRFELLRGYASITAASEDAVTLSVVYAEGGTTSLSAAYVLVATGSEIQFPDVSGLKESAPWTSDTLLDAATIPESFIVLGGGAVALEMAHYLEAIGRRITVLQRNTQLLTGMDRDLGDVVQAAFEKRGMSVHCGTRLHKVEATSHGKRVHYEKDGTAHTVEAAEILCALGRRPSTSRLGLDQAGVEMNDKGVIKAGLDQRTTNPRIFAAGDVCGPLEVVHLAIQQGETAAKNAASLLRGGQAHVLMDYRCKLFGVFTEPQAASVGLSEAEAREQDVAFVVVSYPFNDHGKSEVMGEMDGFVKLLADPRSGVLLGGAVVGPHATEMIHEIAVAMHLGATAAQLARAPHYHPTLAEIWTYPAEELEGMIASLIQTPHSQQTFKTE